MAPAGTPSRRKSRSLLVVSPTTTSSPRSSRSTRAQAHQLPEALPNGDAGSSGGKDTVSIAIPSRRTPATARKRKAEEINGLEPADSASPTAEDMIVVESSIRSSGRARTKTAKVVEEEKIAEKKKPVAGERKKGTAAQLSKKSGKIQANGEQHEEPAVEAGDARSTNEEPAQQATPSRKRSRPKGPTKKAEEIPATATRPAPDEPATAVETDPPPETTTTTTTPTTTPRKRGRPKGSANKAKETPATATRPVPDADQEPPTAMETDLPPETTTPNTTPRKRGRPKGSKNRKTLNAAGDPPFEDISIDPSNKSRKLPSHSKPNAAIADSAKDKELEELIANNQELATGQAQTDAAPTPDVSHPPPTTEDPQPAYGELVKLLQKSTHAKNFDTLRSEILLRLSGKKRTPLVGMKREYEQVRSLVEQTVAAGEGNSMLVIGNRGVGKTTLVETALADVAGSHADDFHVIRLTGFIHTDDKLALREIWRQLGRAMELPDADQAIRSNYADTLASLLAVLSHPAEITGDATTAQTSKSVVFVLDEFNLFASHPRQTLLYNLFDIAQSRKAPIAVLGLTTKIDVTEMLEKRVKSRFSHRYVHLPLPRNYTTFLAIIQAALHCLPEPEFAPPQSAPSTSSLSATDKNQTAILKAWTTHIASALHSEPLSTGLRRIYATSKSMPTILTGLFPPLASSSPTSPPTASSLAMYLAALSPPDSKLTLLPSLSDAQLALLVCAARCDVLLASDAVNFLLAYDEYVRCTTRARVAAGLSTGVAKGAAAAPLAAPGMPRVWSRDVCLAAWEGLANKGLLVPVLGTDQGMGGRLASAVGGAGDAGKRGRLWRVDVSLEEIGRAIQGWGGAAREMQRWCRSL